MKKRNSTVLPWKRTLQNIKTRCSNPNRKDWKHYGKRGIKCLITEEELKFLWFRDEAFFIKNPTIDRKDNDGNYELSNCRYIEKGLNSAERNRRVSSIPIFQYDLQGNFIKEWINIRDAERTLNIDHSSIGRCCKGRQHTAGGFKWEYK